MGDLGVCGFIVGSVCGYLVLAVSGLFEGGAIPWVGIVVGRMSTPVW